MRHKILLVFALLILAGGFVLPKLFLREARPLWDQSADLLHIIRAAQIEYARTHPDKGFASSLAQLGPDSADALIDSVLASGRKSGYVFFLSAAPPDSQGRIMHYTVVARPQKYEKDRRSFFMDESGIEHFTAENRAPTSNDPLLK